MARFNGRFEYAYPIGTTKDPDTGFYTKSGPLTWLDGTDCQIDRNIPAKTYVGDDGSENSYQYNIFIKDRRYAGKLNIGTRLHLTFENGFEDDITICYVDETRKYIEVWG
jgi:hypothetical protein